MVSVAQARVGLARALSKLGYCSRSTGFSLVRAGRVAVNGTVQRNPERPVAWQRDRIEVEGKPVTAAAKVYMMLNKPRGLVTTASDEKGRETVYALLDESLSWIGPIGRLDKASEGLLLMTNDSEWAARVAAPETHLDKTYHVQVAEIADPKLVSCLIRGVNSKGERLRAKAATIVRSAEKNSWIEIVLDEGKNRHIRRMLAACGIDILRLIRVAIGPLQLGDLAKGASRALTQVEKTQLDAAISSQRKGKSIA